MIRQNLVFAVFILSVIGLIFSQVYGQENYDIPQWIKNNAKLWADNSLDDSGFESGIQYLMNVGIIQGSPQSQTISETKIPKWVKISAGWWADGKISDSDFINGIGYLIKTGEIQFKTTSEPAMLQGTITPYTTPATTTPVTTVPNATILQNMKNSPVTPANTTPVMQPIKILLLISNYPVVYSTQQYSFQAKVFDASQVASNQADQNTFNQNWGTLSGVRVQVYLTSSDNKTTFYTWDGLTNQFGYFVGSTLMRNEPTNQLYFVHFNATKSGMINASQTVQFHLLNSGS